MLFLVNVFIMQLIDNSTLPNLRLNVGVWFGCFASPSPSCSNGKTSLGSSIDRLREVLYVLMVCGMYLHQDILIMPKILKKIIDHYVMFIFGDHIGWLVMSCWQQVFYHIADLSTNPSVHCSLKDGKKRCWKTRFPSPKIST